MLTHKIYVTLDTSAGLIRDASGTKTAPAPEFILGVGSQLQITFLEAAGRPDVVDLSTAAKNVTAWEFLVAQDFSSATPLLFVADQGKIHIEDNSLIIPISTNKTNEAVAWLNDSEIKSGLFGELNGYDNNGEPIFYCLLKNLSLRQRIAPGADPSVLPDTFIDAAQVRAILASGAALEFSVDKISWHTEQRADDSYLRFRSNSSESAVWSEAIELPAGAKGEQGAEGAPGVAAGFGTVQAAVNHLPSDSEPTVAVSVSGENSAKNFFFEFGIPKAASVAAGTADVVFCTVTAVDEDNGSVTVSTASGEIHTLKFKEV